MEMKEMPPTSSETPPLRYLTLHTEFLLKAQDAEAEADRRAKAIFERERKELLRRWHAQRDFWRDRNFDTELQVISDQARAKDPIWKSAVGLNQWYIAKATMYGVAAMNELLLQRLEIPSSFVNRPNA